MKVIILGGNGNLGTQLRQAWPEALAWDQEDFDFLDFPVLQERLESMRPELIINAVAYNAVDKCEADQDELALAYRLNRDLVKRLAEIAVNLSVSLIHYSTDYVFSGDESRPSFKEDDVPNPINKYGLTKAAGEQALAQVAANSHLFYYLIRTSKLFGPRGASPLAKISFFDLMLSLAEKGEEIKIVAEEVSNFTYTTDLAQATKALFESRPAKGIYHLTNSGSATWFQAAEELFRLKGLKPALKAVRGADLARPARRPAYSILKNNKLKPLRPWTEALKEYLNL